MGSGLGEGYGGGALPVNDTGVVVARFDGCADVRVDPEWP